MAENCRSCGAELFAGQQFCRACGTPTRQFSGEELPTQMLPPSQQQQPQQPASLNTSPLPARATSDPVNGTGLQINQSHTAPQPLQQSTSPVGVLPEQHYRRRRSRVWLYAVLGLVVFCGGASLVVGLFLLNQPHQAKRKIVRTMTHKPPVPPAPLGVRVEANEWMIDEEGAETSDEQTIITKTYPLAKDGSFKLHNIRGDITVEGWDEPQAEVKIIKRGGSEKERAGLKIMREEKTNRLAFSTMPGAQGGGAGREVQYQVKLPRNLRELEIVSNDSNVDLINVNTASISITLQRGNINLEDVSGTINSRTTKGNTKVVIGEGAAARTAPQVFNGISGNIELELAPGTNAELKAETIKGQIEIDEEFGLKVEKRMMGEQAVGRLGTGGQPIVVKVVSGNIKIKS